MTKMMLIPILLFLTSAAFADEPLNSMIGKYSNSKYNGTWYVAPGEYQKAEVEIYVNQNGKPEMIFSIPCDTKLRAARLTVQEIKIGGGELTVADPGSGQCYLGTNPRFAIYGSVLRIDTDFEGLGIGVPGFNGVYELTKE